MQRGSLGPDHPKTLESRNNLAVAYYAAGRLSEAIALFEATLKTAETKLGPDHPDTLKSRNNLADGLPGRRPHRRGHPRCTRQTLKLMEAKLGPDHPDTLTEPQQPRRAYRAAGRIAEAIALHEADAQAAGGEARPRPPRHAHQPQQPRRRPTTPPAGRRGDRAARGDAQAAGGEARPRPPRHAHQPQQPGRRLPAPPAARPRRSRCTRRRSS